MSERDGGPAFPRAGNEFDGMSIRDWFAGQALAGLVSIPEDRIRYTPEKRAALDAAHCYQMADAMLAERNKERV